MVNKTTPGTQTHRVRTFFASVLGAFGVSLLLFSIVLVWLNRTLTDTKTFTSVTAPLVTNADIQNFVAAKVASGIVDKAPRSELAAQLLTPEQSSGKNEQELKALLEPVIKQKVISIIGSASIKAQWTTTIKNAHAQLKEQLASKSPELTLDFSPLLTDVIDQLKANELAPIDEEISLGPDQGKLKLSGGGIEKAHDAYRAFQAGTIAVVIVSLLLIASSVALSVHHSKTLRRLLILVGLGALGLAALIQLPSFVTLSSDPVDAAAAKAITTALFHDMQVASLVIAAFCLLTAVASKVFDVARSKGSK